MERGFVSLSILFKAESAVERVFVSPTPLLTTASPVEKVLFKATSAVERVFVSPTTLLKAESRSDLPSEITLSTSQTPHKNNSSRASTTPVIVGSFLATALVVFVIAVLIITSMGVYIRRNRKSKSLLKGTGERETDLYNVDRSELVYSGLIRKDHIYVYATEPTVCSAFNKNRAYNAHIFDDTHTSWNDAYELCSANQQAVQNNNYEPVVPVKPNVSYTGNVSVELNSAYMASVEQEVENCN